MGYLLSTIAVEVIFLFVLPIIGSEIIRKRQPFNQWSLKRWWLIFFSASVTDIASTYFVVWFRNMSWAVEQNIPVMILGPSLGHEKILLLENLVAILLFYSIAHAVRGSKSRTFFIWFFCVSSLVRMGAAMCNVLLSSV